MQFPAPVRACDPVGMKRALMLTLGLFASCGPPVVSPDAAVDAPDTGIDAPDAMVDAPVDPGPIELTRPAVMAASGQAQGAGFTIEFQLGHPPVHAPAGAGSTLLETAAPIAP